MTSDGRFNLEGRLNKVEYIVTKRVANLNYIRKVHEGDVYWLNVVKLSKDDIINFYHPQTLQKRVQQWFYMGVSVAPLLQLSNGWQFIRACAQLMEEYEYHFSNVAVQGMKMLKALTTSYTDDESTKTIKPVINKVGGTVIYEFLRTPNIPCELDYTQVVFSLCDILTFVYRKLMDESSASSNLLENIIKLDGKFKHHFFGLISRDLNTLAMFNIKHKLSTVENIFEFVFQKKENEEKVEETPKTPKKTPPPLPKRDKTIRALSSPKKEDEINLNLDEEIDDYFSV